VSQKINAACLSIFLLPGLLLSLGCDSGTDTEGASNGWCDGCVAGNSGNGNDAIQIESVSGLDDGADDDVTVEGNYTLDSATEASLVLRCDGDSGGEASLVSAGTNGFSAESTFMDCEPGIIMLSLWEVGSYGDSVFVDCCFREGQDF